jgi:peptidyl-dipeptidase Dcp
MTLPSCKNEPAVDKSNPFFNEYNTPFNIPPFEKIMAKHYMEAFEKGFTDGRKDIQAITGNSEEPSFENTIAALDKSGSLLTNVKNVFLCQASANTNDSLQDIEVEISPRLSAHEDEQRLNPELFKKIKYVWDNQAKFNLNPEQKYTLHNLYREFVRNGANLSPEDQVKLKAINQKLSVLTVTFDQNVLGENNLYRLVVDKDGLAGLPESVIEPASEVAKAAGQDGKWAFTLQRPSIFPFLQYSENRELRHQIFNAYTNRGNNGNEFDNNKILAEIIALRAERAKLLGYRNHSEFVLEPRMAKEPENVLNLLNRLWEKAIPVAKNEVTEMQKIIDKEGGKFKLEPSDWWYYAEKLRKEKYDLNDEELKPYFELENVKTGLLSVANKLYGITFTPLTDCPLPHPEAVAYEVKDTNGSHLAVLYMDFFPRDSKQQGAWQSAYRTHQVLNGKEITPVVTTVFNFSRPGEGSPALLTLEEVSTLYHEFGHALDEMFHRNSYNEIYIAYDFVELPSQLMEHWASEPEVLNLYAKHFQTGELIPESLVKKLRNSGYFNQGFSNTEIYAASLLDMAYHTLEAPVNIDIQSFEKEFFDRLGLIPEIVSRYRSTYFSHITGEYDSGYYGYTWAAVLDNDAFEAFKEHGLYDKATAKSFRENILEKNGIMDPMEMYVNFRGHEPSEEPYLRNIGFLTE